MAHDAHSRSVVQSVRAHRIAGQLRRKRNGTSTRNYHRFRRFQAVGFYVVLGLMVLGIASLAIS